MEESRSGRNDPCWKYSTPDPNDKNTVTCNFCGKQTKGGIFRAKKHLVGGFRDVKKCPLCPPSVRQEIATFMTRKAKDKEEMGMSSFSSNVHGFGFGESDEGEDVYVADKMLSKQIQASVGIESSKGGKRKANFKGPMDAFLTVNAEHGTRKALAMKEPRCDAVEKCAIWLITSGIFFEFVEDPNFQQAWNLLCQFSLQPVAWEPPSVHELSLVLQDEKKKICVMLKSHEEEWVKYGCTLILDGWHDEVEKKDILNVLVNSSKGMAFLMSIDVSNCVNDAQTLFSLFDRIVKKVGAENVVQVVTDNASPYAAAGKMLEMQRTHLFWSPCATQCIELMLEDIGKIPRIRGAIMNVVFLNSYLYSQTGASNLLKKYSGKRELVKPAVTRFATTFMTLKSIREQKYNLRRMVVSDDWRKKKWSKEIEAKRCFQVVLKESFWRDVVYALKLTIPLVKVLALVYSVKPSMGHIYGAIHQAKEAIMKSFNYNEEKYKEAIKIIDNRWQCQLHQPLHAAGHFFNPSVFFDDRQAILDNHDIMNALHHCIERLARSQDEKDAINLELAMYQNAESIFGRDVIRRQSKTRSPVDWWEQYGNVVPHLQKLAISILSQSCSATRYEKSWDTFQKLHSDLYIWERPRHKKMLFVRYNLALFRQHNYQNEIDPLLTNNIDESNEWLVGIMDDATEDEANEPYYLNWFNVKDTFGKLSIPDVDKEEEEEFDDGEEGEDGFDLVLPGYSEDEDDMEGDF